LLPDSIESGFTFGTSTYLVDRALQQELEENPQELITRVPPDLEIGRYSFPNPNQCVFSVDEYRSAEPALNDRREDCFRFVLQILYLILTEFMRWERDCMNPCFLGTAQHAFKGKQARAWFWARASG
jgi:hypothetical protein